MTQEEGALAELAAKLTGAQRRAVLTASFSEGQGVWHPKGWYVYAERRVRYNLARKGLIRDYLRASNPLTDLGLRLRAFLTPPQPEGE